MGELLRDMVDALVEVLVGPPAVGAVAVALVALGVGLQVGAAVRRVVAA